MGKELTVNVQIEDIFANMKKRTKGYGFDSLVFRYKIAREEQARYELERDRHEGVLKEENYYLRKANRDIIRFIEILDDLIGEHD